MTKAAMLHLGASGLIFAGGGFIGQAMAEGTAMWLPGAGLLVSGWAALVLALRSLAEQEPE
jgi:hypothetical protein